MSLIASKRQHHFRPLCHLYLFILVFIYLSHPACGAAWRMPPALHVRAMAPLGPAPYSWGPGIAKEWECHLMAKDCSKWPGRWGRPGKCGVRTHFCQGFGCHQSQKCPLSKDWGSLEKFCGAFWMYLLLGTRLRVHVKGHAHPLFHQGLGVRSPHAHRTLATHQFFSEAIGARVFFFFGCSSNCPMPLTFYSYKRGIWVSSLLILPGRHSQLLHCRLLRKDMAG